MDQFSTRSISLYRRIDRFGDEWDERGCRPYAVFHSRSEARSAWLGLRAPSPLLTQKVALGRARCVLDHLVWRLLWRFERASFRILQTASARIDFYNGNKFLRACLEVLYDVITSKQLVGNVPIKIMTMGVRQEEDRIIRPTNPFQPLRD